MSEEGNKKRLHPNLFKVPIDKVRMGIIVINTLQGMLRF